MDSKQLEEIIEVSILDRTDNGTYCHVLVAGPDVKHSNLIVRVDEPNSLGIPTISGLSGIELAASDREMVKRIVRKVADATRWS